MFFAQWFPVLLSELINTVMGDGMTFKGEKFNSIKGFVSPSVRQSVSPSVCTSTRNGFLEKANSNKFKFILVTSSKFKKICNISQLLAGSRPC